ncbi:ShlB/FhaC/HecB family hemolysin secretion/activation protein [Luteolibacter luteus]|uniref:ShlB/FhaC/HecB family hemolysin secretion/activation protein n=1 Tax=Luteolibacter luteus TaxID=2728835 RepID=A0A858RF69_9BACT|nr:ShlB/FhaC/HecB family hemolysin secretion/activation protein [Luteolibacter luteus]QJE94793.1 ShlB/FhaC/HecB family hemolysin secretion/activation protein [Luteolibacter luteus]
MRLILAVLLIASARGQSLPGVEPRLPEAPAPESLPKVEAGEPHAEGDLLCDQLRSITLMTTEGAVASEVAPGLRSGSDLRVPAPRTLAARLKKWLGAPLHAGDLADLADQILIHFDEEGFPVVLVEAPQQDLAKGELVLHVEIGKVGNVGLSRSKLTSSEVLQKGLRLTSGEPIRRPEIDEQLAWYGRTVFRHPRLFVSPGAEPATADFLIGFEESKPWRVTTGYENSGPDLLGRDRFLLGVAGLTPNDHLIAWQSVVGMPASSLLANAIRWEVPFATSHQLLQIDAAYAEVLSRYASNGFPVESEGSSWSFAAAQKIPLPSLGAWRQSFSAGFEVKGTDQFLLFGGSSLSPGEVLFFNGKLSHEISRTWESGSISLDSALLAAPMELGGNNEDSAFKAYDPAADATYVIGRMNGDAWWSPGADWQLHLRGSGQVADSRLLPAEQFSVGGYQTVRGVSEREYSADCGWLASVEVLTPVIRPMDEWGFRFLTFFDYAGLEDRRGASSSVSGAGLGLRMRITDHMDLRFDHGWRVDESENRSHFGLNLNF